MIELELLNALDWRLEIELPFQHFNEIKPLLGELVEKIGDGVEKLVGNFTYFSSIIKRL